MALGQVWMQAISPSAVIKPFLSSTPSNIYLYLERKMRDQTIGDHVQRHGLETRNVVYVRDFLPILETEGRRMSHLLLVLQDQNRGGQNKHIGNFTDWSQIREIVIRAFGPYPEARAAVVRR